MSAPRRWVDDPDADVGLQQLLRESAGAQPLDAVTRRRVGSKVARAVAVPVMAAGWVLFVKSAAAALGAVGVAATVATVTGVIEWPERRGREQRAVPVVQTPRPAASPITAPPPMVVEEVPEPEPKLNPSPSLPVASPSGSGAASLSAESTLLEQARREMRRAPAVALQIAGEHSQRFPHGQLTAERTLIEVEALHRLGRKDQARARAQSLLRGAAGTLYAERVERLLGE
jgi:hypothetical protein